MSLRAKRRNLLNFGDCHPSFRGTNAPRNDTHVNYKEIEELLKAHGAKE